MSAVECFFKASCLQSISFIMRFDFKKYSSLLSPVKKVAITLTNLCKNNCSFT